MLFLQKRRNVGYLKRVKLKSRIFALPNNVEKLGRAAGRGRGRPPKRAAPEDDAPEGKDDAPEGDAPESYDNLFGEDDAPEGVVDDSTKQKVRKRKIDTVDVQRRKPFVVVVVVRIRIRTESTYKKTYILPHAYEIA